MIVILSGDSVVILELLVSIQIYWIISLLVNTYCVVVIYLSNSIN